MTEKVKVSQAEFEWLERYKSEAEIDYAINIQPLNKRPDSPIVDWKPSEVARALLYNGYEIEPEPLQVGDWVKRELKGRYIYGQIDTTAFDDVIFNYFGKEQNPARVRFHKGDVILMTPEEIQAEKERQKWAEIEVGDVLRGKHSGAFVRLVQVFPEKRMVDVLLRNERFESWDMDACELYAKKVGASNA